MISARSIPRASLGGAERNAMYAVFRRNFDGIRREWFYRDLDEKNHVILLERTDGQLIGFSTLLLYDTEYRGERFNVVYSGDTIVDRDAWDSSTLPRAWIKTVLDLKQDAARLVWLLIVSGFRTYRFLPVFFKHFFPSHDNSATPETLGLMDKLAHERFGSFYDPNRKIVRFPHPQRLRSDLAAIPPGRRRNSHVAHFERLNPGHAQGDELVCVTEIDEGNLTHAGKRMLGEFGP